jgi:hypothetical protein
MKTKKSQAPYDYKITASTVCSTKTRETITFLRDNLIEKSKSYPQSIHCSSFRFFPLCRQDLKIETSSAQRKLQTEFVESAGNSTKVLEEELRS